MTTAVRHGLRAALQTGFTPVHAYWAYGLSFLRSQCQVVRVWPEGRVALSANVALFTHFDRRGQLADHVVAYVQALHQSGFSVIFVSNAGRRLQADLTRLQPFCKAIVARRNVGYDFGAVREMLTLFDLPRQETERLLVVNDSVYGPLAPINRILARVDLDEADVWGLTDSWQHRYHLQSYFLLASRRAMISPAWQEFWDKVRPVSSKHWVIHHYEIGLTQHLLRAGLRCQSLWGYHELLDQIIRSPPYRDDDTARSDPLLQMRIAADRRLRAAIARLLPLNPTSDLWRQLLQAGFPFLKVELLRKNPTEVPDIADWRSVVSRLPHGNVTMIERDLQVQSNIRNRAP